MKWEDILFIIKWMCENVDTSQLTLPDDYQLEKITDDAHGAFMKAKYYKQSFLTEPMEHCFKCGRGYLTVWQTTDKIWELITGIKDGSGLMCMDCFDQEAQKKGITLYWECAIGKFPAQLRELLQQQGNCPNCALPFREHNLTCPELDIPDEKKVPNRR